MLVRLFPHACSLNFDVHAFFIDDVCIIICSGNNFFWFGVLLCYHRMANFWHDIGNIWFHCPFQVCWIYMVIFHNLICVYVFLMFGRAKC